MHLCAPESQKWGLDAPFAYVIGITIVIDRNHLFSCILYFTYCNAKLPSDRWEVPVDSAVVPQNRSSVTVCL